MPSDSGKGNLIKRWKKRFRRGKKRGRLGSCKQAAGCICPNCRFKISYQPSISCFETKCPRCRTPMARLFPQGWYGKLINMEEVKKERSAKMEGLKTGQKIAMLSTIVLFLLALLKFVVGYRFNSKSGHYRSPAALLEARTRRYVCRGEVRLC